MLRVGLTGELGSGKSTVAHLLAARGAVVLSSDEMGRAMMQPGEAVYNAIVQHFGPAVVRPDGTLDRGALAQLAFDPAHPRIEELNALVHPAVLAEQERLLAELAHTQPNSIAVVESALIFTTLHAGGDRAWATRFDCIVLVTAPEALKIERYVERYAHGRSLSPQERAAAERDARSRLAAQRITPADAAASLQIENAGDLASLETAVDTLFAHLQALAGQRAS